MDYIQPEFLGRCRLITSLVNSTKQDYVNYRLDLNKIIIKIPDITKKINSLIELVLFLKYIC